MKFSPTPAQSSSAPSTRALALWLALLTLVVFLPVWNAQFISLDDPEYVTANPHVQSGLTPRAVVWAFSLGYGANWHPLTWLSHLLDVSLFGVTPAGPHVVNLLLHLANSLLVFSVLGKMTGAHWRSAFVAALFALHPLHVESVAWVSERKDVLSTFFWMLTIWAYVKSVEGRGERREADAASGLTPHASRFYILALVFFALGLLAKPMLVTLPFVLLLLDFWPLKRGSRVGGRGEALDAPSFDPRPSTLRTLFLEKLPFFALAAISCAMTMRAQKNAVQTWTEFSPGVRIQNAFVSCARYLGKTFWPVDLAIPYPHPGQWPWPLVIGSVLLVVVVSAGAVWLRRRQPFLFTGWFWFLGTLVPVIGVIQVGIQSLADRYTYVPSIGLFLALVWGGHELFARWRLPGALAKGVAAAVLVACAARTRDQLRYWQNSESLFRHAIAVTKNNALAHYSLGYCLAEKNRIEDAIEQYQLALRIRADSPEMLENLGNAYVNLKRFEAAVPCYEAALRLDPESVSLHSNLGATLDTLGKTDEAIHQFTEALRLAPDATTHYRLANTLARLGRNDQALDHYRQAVESQPDSVEARNNYGAALFNLRRLDEAGEQFRELLRLHPEYIGAHYNLGNVFAMQGKWAEAAKEYAEAARLAPASPENHFAFGFALARMGRREEAVAQLNEALRLKPDFAPAKQLLESLQAPSP